MTRNTGILQGATPYTMKIAVVFIACTLYFISDMYFLATEYYAETPPYFIYAVVATISGLMIFRSLRRKEPERKDSAAFSLIFGLGIALALYAFVPRLNIMTDTSGINSYQYTLDDQHIWKSTDNVPELALFLAGSRWWEQFKPGDSYVFQLRKGGLGIWLVDMSEIYAAQKEFYECSKLSDCIFADSYK